MTFEAEAQYDYFKILINANVNLMSMLIAPSGWNDQGGLFQHIPGGSFER